jgi:hypothetical protein
MNTEKKNKYQRCLLFFIMNINTISLLEPVSNFYFQNYIFKNFYFLLYLWFIEIKFINNYGLKNVLNFMKFMIFSSGFKVQGEKCEKMETAFKPNIFFIKL